MKTPDGSLTDAALDEIKERLGWIEGALTRIADALPTKRELFALAFAVQDEHANYGDLQRAVNNADNLLVALAAKEQPHAI